MTVHEDVEVEALGASECRALAPTVEVGRLAFTDRHGPTVHPVNFTVHDGKVVMQVGAAGGARAAVGQMVAFEVDEIDPVTRTAWSVVASGPLELADDTDAPVPESWPAPDDGVLLRVRVGRWTGRRLRRRPRRVG